MFRILRCRTVAAIYPHRSFECEVDIDGVSAFFNFDVEDGRPVTIVSMDDIAGSSRAYKVPLDEVNLSSPEDVFSSSQELDVFKEMALLWNMHPAWDKDPSWKPVFFCGASGYFYGRKSDTDDAGKNYTVDFILGNPDDSFVIYDPDRKIYSRIASTLTESGYKVSRFDLDDIDRSDSYNPLKYILDDTDMDAFLINFFSCTDEAFVLKAEEYAASSGRMDLYRSCIRWLMEYQFKYSDDSGKSSVPTLYDVSYMIKKAGKGTENMINDRGLEEFFAACPDDSKALMYYREFKDYPSDVRYKILYSSMLRMHFLMSPDVKKILSSDTLCINKMHEKKTALFVFEPSVNTGYSFLVKMLCGQIGDIAGKYMLKKLDRALPDEMVNSVIPIHLVGTTDSSIWLGL